MSAIQEKIEPILQLAAQERREAAKLILLSLGDESISHLMSDEQRARVDVECHEAVHGPRRGKNWSELVAWIHQRRKDEPEG